MLKITTYYYLFISELMLVVFINLTNYAKYYHNDLFIVDFTQFSFLLHRLQ